jgi:Ni/Fe-hydrogenase 1 B-type cytochrome subunit
MSTPSSYQPAVYVYEGPLRIWHWINALAIAVLIGTGYFIASPMSSMPGEASDHFLMGYIRFAHFAAGYVLIVGFIGRVYWMIVGNWHAREIFFPQIASGKWWAEVVHEIKWYAFIARQPKKYEGHNPLATLVMFLFVWGVVFMIFTGLALYGEGAGMTSWQYRYFSSWVIPLFGNSQDVHTYHHLVMWAFVLFIMVHVYAAFREDVMSRQSIISTMISGWRTFKDTDRPEDHRSRGF